MSVFKSLAAHSASLVTVAMAILAQFAPWLQTPAKATIGGVGALVAAIYTHDHHVTVRAAARPPVAPAVPPAPIPVTVVAPAPPSAS